MYIVLYKTLIEIIQWSNFTLYFSPLVEPYPDVTFYLHIRRRASYHVVNILVPCVLLSCLSLAVFLLPARASEKILLSLTVLLMFSIFIRMIAENTPDTSEFVPIIGKVICNLWFSYNLL